MASVIIMPKQGLLMEEGTITKWLAKEGEQTTEGAPLFEMETDKLTITMDSTATGHRAENPASRGGHGPHHPAHRHRGPAR